MAKTAKAETSGRILRSCGVLRPRRACPRTSENLSAHLADNPATFASSEKGRSPADTQSETARIAYRLVRLTKT